ANQTLPSAPPTRSAGALPVFRPLLNSVIAPPGVIRPIAFVVPMSLNQRLPSGAGVIDLGELPAGLRHSYPRQRRTRSAGWPARMRSCRPSCRPATTTPRGKKESFRVVPVADEDWFAVTFKRGSAHLIWNVKVANPDPGANPCGALSIGHATSG